MRYNAANKARPDNLARDICNCRLIPHSLNRVRSPFRVILIRLFSFAVVIALVVLSIFPLVFAGSGTSQWYPPDLNSLSEADWAGAFEQIRKSQVEFGVESVDEFKAITRYYDARIRDGVELHRFRLRNSDTIQCIIVHTQQSLSASGCGPESLQFSPQIEPLRYYVWNRTH